MPSMVRTRGSRVKYFPSRAATASSAVRCIHSRSAPVPCSWFAGSAFSTSIASAMVAPGPATSRAMASCSAVIRTSDSTPHS